MIPLGTLVSALGAKLVTDIVAKKAAHDVIKKHSPLVVVYAKGQFVATRHFNDHSKAVAFQREIAAHKLPSYLMEVGPDGRLIMQPIVTMSGLGDTWIRSNYGQPKGEFSSMVKQQGKQGYSLVSANEVNAQAWADEMGPHDQQGQHEGQDAIPYYAQSYGSTYEQRVLPKDVYGPSFYPSDVPYNMVNPHNV